MTNDRQHAERGRGATAADGHHDDIPTRIGGFRTARNVYGAIEWTDGEESVFCRRVDGQWQALVVRNGRTRTLSAGLGSKNHALWLAREYMEFGETYENRDVWSELPARERANPFRDVVNRRENAPLL